jgi:hypothetical protein
MVEDEKRPLGPKRKIPRDGRFRFWSVRPLGQAGNVQLTENNVDAITFTHLDWWIGSAANRVVTTGRQSGSYWCTERTFRTFAGLLGVADGTLPTHVNVYFVIYLFIYLFIYLHKPLTIK